MIAWRRWSVTEALQSPDPIRYPRAAKRFMAIAAALGSIIPSTEKFLMEIFGGTKAGNRGKLAKISPDFQ